MATQYEKNRFSWQRGLMSDGKGFVHAFHKQPTILEMVYRKRKFQCRNLVSSLKVQKLAQCKLNATQFNSFWAVSVRIKALALVPLCDSVAWSVKNLISQSVSPSVKKCSLQRERLVRPILKYGGCVFGSSGCVSSKGNWKIQNRADRFVTSNSYN